MMNNYDNTNRLYYLSDKFNVTLIKYINKVEDFK